MSEEVKMEITRSEFRTMLDWFMSSDPWPMTREEHEEMEAMLDRISREQGFDGWIEAFRELPKVPHE